jgi:hypothetical protein
LNGLHYRLLRRKGAEGTQRKPGFGRETRAVAFICCAYINNPQRPNHMR